MDLNLDSIAVDDKGKVSFSGLSSGIDFQSVVENIIAAKRIPIDTLETRVSNNELKIAALKDLSSGLEALKESLAKLYGKVSFGNTANLFEMKQAFASTSRIDGGTASAASALIGVSVTNAAAAGEHTLELLQTAKSHKVASDAQTSTSSTLGFSNGEQIVVNGQLGYLSASQASATTTVGSSGTLEFTDVDTGLVIGSVAYSASDTITALASAIDSAITGVSAEVEQTGSQYQLRIDGEARFTMAETGGGSALTDLSIADRNAVTLSSSDTLADLRDRINNANTGADPIGVTASIVSVSSTEHYLLLTRDDMGETMTLQEVGSGDALETIGVLAAGGAINNELQAAAHAQFYADGLIDFTNTAYESGLQSSSTGLIGSAGTLTFTLDSDGSPIGTVNYLATDSLTDLAAAITANVTGVTAEMVSDGAGYRLSITGTDAFSFADSGDAVADLSIDNARRVIERNTNTVSDLFAGVTVNLFQAEQGSTVTISVETDLAEIKTQVAAFVDAYNNLRGFINLQRTSESDATQEQKDAGAGLLIGSQGLTTVDQALQQIIGQGATGVSAEFSVLRQIGVEFVDNNQVSDPLMRNTLTLDESTLDEALLNNLDDVRRLFTFDFTSSDSRVSLLGFDGTTTRQDGGYSLNLQPVSGTNLHPYSEEADNAYYNQDKATILADAAIAPDGSQTADAFAADTQNSTHYVYPASVETLNAGTYNFSSYVKLGSAGTADSFRLALAGGAFGGSEAYADFNLQTGTLTTLGPKAEGASIEDVGNGWYRVSVTATTEAGGNVYFERSPRVEGQNTFVGADDTANPELYLWGAQVAPVDVDNSLVSSPTGVEATVGTSGTETAPDGTAALQLTASTNNTTHYAKPPAPIQVVAGQSYTMSAMFKAGTEPSAMLRFDGANFPALARATFDLTTGTIQSIDPGADDATIEDLGGGWYRATVTGTAIGTGDLAAELYTVSAGGLGFAGANDPANPELYFSNWFVAVDGNETPGGYIATEDTALVDVVASANVDGATSGQNDGTATVNGNLLSVDSGGAAGLQMYFSSFDGAATVNLDFTIGIGAQLYFEIEDLLDTDFGAVESEITTLTGQNETSQDRIEEMLQRLEVQRKTLLEKFLRMETALATAQRILDSIKQTTDAFFANRNN